MNRWRLVASMMRQNVSKGNKMLLVQLCEMTSLYLRRGFSPLQYYNYGLSRKDACDLGSLNYLSRRTYWEMQNRLNREEWSALSSNKWLFYTHMRTLGLPVPQCYGYFDRINGRTVDGLPLRSATDLQILFSRNNVTEFVIKPVHGGMGANVLVISCREHKGSYESLDGRVFTVEELANLMSTEPYLIQTKVQQCDYLNKVNPFTLNTFRVVTFIDANGECQIHFAALRTGRRGHNTDNAHTGGVSCVVNLDTGELGMGKHLEGPPRYHAHPDSGFDFAGKAVPEWQAVRQLALEAGRCCPLASVGWDIAVSVDGPVLIEVNTRWAYRQPQAHSPYLNPERRKHLASHNIYQP